MSRFSLVYFGCLAFFLCSLTNSYVLRLTQLLRFRIRNNRDHINDGTGENAAVIGSPTVAKGGIDWRLLFEGDVVEYQLPTTQDSHVKTLGKTHEKTRTHSLAAVTCNRKLQPLYRRESESDSTELLLYGDDDQEEMTLDDSICITAMIDDFQYTQRIVEDRVSNPHGEHAEDVWILRGASVINSVISKPDLHIRIGDFQH